MNSGSGVCGVRRGHRLGISRPALFEYCRTHLEWPSYSRHSASQSRFLLRERMQIWVYDLFQEKEIKDLDTKRTHSASCGGLGL